MGFRSTFVSEPLPGALPEWFLGRYRDTVGVTSDNVLHSLRECKLYTTWEHLADDLRRALFDTAGVRRERPAVLVFLHECGGITRLEIGADAVRWTEPAAWSRVREPSHHYCYGCSDAAFATPTDGGA